MAGARGQWGRSARHTLTATLADRQKAEEAFQGLAGKLPARASAELFGQTVLVELPVDHDLEQKWLAELRSKSADVRVDTPTARVGWTFVATAPSEEAAIRIERDVQVYLLLSRRGFLSPPWSPKPLTAQSGWPDRPMGGWKRPVTTRPQKRGEEQEYLKLIGKGQEAMEKFRASYDKMRQESVAKAVAELRREGKQPVDARVLDLYSTVAVPGPARRNPLELSVAEQELYADGTIAAGERKAQAGR